MKELKLLWPSIVVIAMCSLALLFSPVHGASPAGEVTLTQQEFKTLKSNLNELESTINNQLTTISELEMQLRVAKLSTSEQKNELVEALNLIKEQRTQLTEARNLLQKQEQMLNEQRISLAKAEVYLNEQKNELAKMKIKQRNSTLLNIALGAGVVYFASK